LSEMCRADALLVMQASNSNEQIPAKLYEYLRARRPVLCLADPAGDTAGAMRRAGIDTIARLDAPQDIAAMLPGFIESVRSGMAVVANADAVRRASRRERARVLAEHLDRVAMAAVPQGAASVQGNA
jgi:hypothetical protein